MHTQKESFGEHDNKIKFTRFDQDKRTRSSKTVDNYMDEFIIFSLKIKKMVRKKNYFCKNKINFDIMKKN